MARCIDCAFIIHEDTKKNFICSIEKIKHPGMPEYYLKNENSISCMSNYRKVLKDKKNIKDE